MNKDIVVVTFSFLFSVSRYLFTKRDYWWLNKVQWECISPPLSSGVESFLNTFPFRWKTETQNTMIQMANTREMWTQMFECSKTKIGNTIWLSLVKKHSPTERFYLLSLNLQPMFYHHHAVSLIFAKIITFISIRLWITVRTGNWLHPTKLTGWYRWYLQQLNSAFISYQYFRYDIF